jgi:hypothetical protein
VTRGVAFGVARRDYLCEVLRTAEAGQLDARSQELTEYSQRMSVTFLSIIA